MFDVVKQMKIVYFLFMVSRVVQAMDDQAANGTKLLQAIRSKKMQCIGELVATVSLNTKHKSKSGKSCIPLFFAIVWGNKNIVEILVDNGAEVNFSTDDNVTPLHWAARFGSEEVIAALLKKGADVNAQTRKGETPLYLVVKHRTDYVAKLLLQNNAQVDTLVNGKTIIEHAQEHPNKDLPHILETAVKKNN